MDLRSEIIKKLDNKLSSFFIISQNYGELDYFTPPINFFTNGDKAIKTTPAINE